MPNHRENGGREVHQEEVVEDLVTVTGIVVEEIQETVEVVVVVSVVTVVHLAVLIGKLFIK